MSLYNLSEESVSGLIEQILSNSIIPDARHEVVEETPGMYRYPWKAVFFYENGEITVITAYPLKKGRKK